MFRHLTFSRHRRKGLWLAALLLLLQSGGMHLSAEEDQEPEGSSQQAHEVQLQRVATLGGSVDCFTRRDPYTFITQGDNLRIFDCSDPEHPRQIAWLPLEWPAESIALEGLRLYLYLRGTHSPRNEEQLICFNVADPARPTPIELPQEERSDELIEQFNDDRGVPDDIIALGGCLQNATGILAHGRLAWVKDENLGWFAFDVTQAQTPRLIGSVALPAGDSPIALKDSVVYASGPKPGLRVYTADLAGTCTLRTELPLDCSIAQIAIDGARGVIPLGPKGLALLSLSDPAAPRIIATLTSAEECRQVALHGDRVAAQGDNIILWNASMPRNPTQLGKIWTSDAMTTDVLLLESVPIIGEGSLKSWALADEALAMIWESEMHASLLSLTQFEAGRPLPPLLKDEAGYYDKPVGLSAWGNRLVVECFARNTKLSLPYFRFFEVGQGTIREIGKWEQCAQIADYVLDGDRLYVADGKNGLQILTSLSDKKIWQWANPEADVWGR